MKKIVLLAILATVFMGCAKDEEPTSQAVIVNVFMRIGDEREQIAAPTAVKLYKQKVSEFDLEASISSMSTSVDMKLKDGTSPRAAYISGTLTGINTIDNVENGTYTIIVYHRPDGYNFSFSYHFGYKEITVSNANAQIYKIVFDWLDAGHFVAK